MQRTLSFGFEMQETPPCRVVPTGQYQSGSPTNIRLKESFRPPPPVIGYYASNQRNYHFVTFHMFRVQQTRGVDGAVSENVTYRAHHTQWRRHHSTHRHLVHNQRQEARHHALQLLLLPLVLLGWPSWNGQRMIQSGNRVDVPDLCK